MAEVQDILLRNPRDIGAARVREGREGGRVEKRAGTRIRVGKYVHTGLTYFACAGLASESQRRSKTPMTTPT